MSRYALGIDTSNYRTSCALFDIDAGTYQNIGELLDVPAGQLGLRQSDALFQHVKKLPGLLDRLMTAKQGDIVAVGVSDRPRRQEGSYMPCFLAGVSSARSIAAALGLEACFFSHQEGHIASALYSAGRLNWMDRPFLSWHLSGGTTELLYVRSSNRGVMDVQVIGGTRDIAAGQLIDRAGVALGLPFPSGPHLEKLARSSDSGDFSRVRLDGLFFSFSGVENQFRAALEHGKAPEDVARFVLNTVVQTVRRDTEAAKALYDLPVLFSGGVSASIYLQDAMPPSDDLCYAQQGLGGDNALGAAVLSAIRGGIR